MIKCYKVMLATAALLAAFSCLADNTINARRAQIRVNAAYYEKLKQCGHEPFFVVVVPNDVQEPELVRCEWELLNMSCPATDLPGNCLILMLKKAPHKDLDGQ